MNRRDFFKLLGAGITIPLVGKIEADPLLSNGLTIERLKIAKQKLDEPPVNTIFLKGGYEKFQSYYFLRITVHIREGKSFYHLLRKTGELNIKTITEQTQEVLKEHHLDVYITEKQVEQAFNET